MTFQGGFEGSEGCTLLYGYRQGIPSFGGVAGKRISTFLEPNLGWTWFVELPLVLQWWTSFTFWKYLDRYRGNLHPFLVCWPHSMSKYVGKEKRREERSYLLTDASWSYFPRWRMCKYLNFFQISELWLALYKSIFNTYNYHPCVTDYRECYIIAIRSLSPEQFINDRWMS